MIRTRNFGFCSLPADGCSLPLTAPLHYVVFTAGMQQLKLTRVTPNDTLKDGVLVSTTPGRRSSSLGQLVVRDGDHIAVDCIAVGGCPPPSVVVQMGSRDVTDLFATEVARVLSGRRRGMRRVQYRVVKRHRALTATTSHDGLTLRCLATVPGFGPLSVGLRLTVRCKHACVLHSVIIGASPRSTAAPILR